MKTNVQLSEQILFDSSFDPFAPQFSPELNAAHRSHFQMAFLFVFSKKRKQALANLYAFCRLVDDIADEPGLTDQVRERRLEQILHWISAKNVVLHPFWDQFLKERSAFDIPDEVLEGIVNGVRRDLKSSSFDTWHDLDEYVYGVACCVGQAVLCILGAGGPHATSYAFHLGRALQYLNIMRDLEEDFQNKRVYVPQEFLNRFGKNNVAEVFSVPKLLASIREELFVRACQFRSLAIPYSRHCLIAEMMANLYFAGASRYWRNGHPTRLSKWEKLNLSFKSILTFYTKQILRRRSATPSASN